MITLAAYISKEAIISHVTPNTLKKSSAKTFFVVIIGQRFSALKIPCEQLFPHEGHKSLHFTLLFGCGFRENFWTLVQDSLLEPSAALETCDIVRYSEDLHVIKGHF